MSSSAVAFARQNHPRFLDELKALLRIPSISTLPEHKGDCRKAAEFLASELKRIGMENVRLGNDMDLISQPGVHTSVFNSADPIVHNRVFGLARLDLSTRQVDFKPIGPAPGGMAGLQVTPDKKLAYTIVTNGAFGNKRCEFWTFDLTNDRRTSTMEVPCRSRFSFGMSSDGKKLYIYGAGFEIEVYDTATLKLEKTWDLQNDVTFGGIAVLP